MAREVAQADCPTCLSLANAAAKCAAARAASGDKDSVTTDEVNFYGGLLCGLAHDSPGGGQLRGPEDYCDRHAAMMRTTLKAAALVMLGLNPAEVMGRSHGQQANDNNSQPNASPTKKASS